MDNDKDKSGMQFQPLNGYIFSYPMKKQIVEGSDYPPRRRKIIFSGVPSAH